MTNNPDETGSTTASEAGEILADPNASAEDRSIAGSDLSQRSTGDQTSERVASEAGEVLSDPNATEEERSVAASDLAQSRRHEHDNG
ncbi:hypothetical protein [Naumannella cuiyingiana]|uniref:Uncharacterized protein n=1 Tax=Naumannella cuiyingiana TaxID=1347891 RepID=A0A7Z0D6I1_9ACTN|nr:hypothetical protein [Naumannella cuiyingiana]NYI69661.1 hypothetical protein [Naumannella cuiyingiana]